MICVKGGVGAMEVGKILTDIDDSARSKSTETSLYRRCSIIFPGLASIAKARTTSASI